MEYEKLKKKMQEEYQNAYQLFMDYDDLAYKAEDEINKKYCEIKSEYYQNLMHEIDSEMYSMQKYVREKQA